MNVGGLVVELAAGTGPVGSVDGGKGAAEPLDDGKRGKGGGGGVVGVGIRGGSLAVGLLCDATWRLSSRTGGTGGSRWERAGLL